MMDLRLFRSRHLAAGCLAIAIAFFGLFGFVFMVTQYFQFICGYSPLSAGVRTLPFAGFILVGSALAAKSEHRFPCRVTSTMGLMLMCTGFGWAAQDLANTPYMILVYQMGLLGLGLGLVSASATGTIMGSLSTEQFGVASSINDTARELGGTFGVAIMGSLFNSWYRAGIVSDFATAPLPAEAKEALQHSVGLAQAVIERVSEVAGVAAAHAVRDRVQDAFVGGFHAATVLAAGAAFVGAFIVYFWMPGRSKVVADVPIDESAGPRLVGSGIECSSTTMASTP